MSGLDKVATIDSGTGTDILVGEVNDVSDGSLIGPITAVSGTGVYRLTATVTGLATINGV